MERLKEKSILIGRDPNTNKLLISVNVNGQVKNATIGDNNSVPNSVSRCVPGQDSAHCKIAINQNGDMILTNLKEQNITKVNGDEIYSKRITNANRISLGKENYTFSVDAVIEAAKKLVPPPPVVPKSIKHLEKIYEDYENTLDMIHQSQEKKGKMSRLPIIIGSFGGLLSTLLGALGIFKGLIITIPVTVVPFLLHIKNFTHKDTSYEDRKNAQNKLIDEYVCPHCQHYLGAQPYKVIKQNKKCPHCKGEWIS